MEAAADLVPGAWHEVGGEGGAWSAARVRSGPRPCRGGQRREEGRRRKPALRRQWRSSLRRQRCLLWRWRRRLKSTRRYDGGGILGCSRQGRHKGERVWVEMTLRGGGPYWIWPRCGARGGGGVFQPRLALPRCEVRFQLLYREGLRVLFRVRWTLPTRENRATKHPNSQISRLRWKLLGWTMLPNTPLELASNSGETPPPQVSNIGLSYSFSPLPQAYIQPRKTNI
jgi:hypothetical protein